MKSIFLRVLGAIIAGILLLTAGFGPREAYDVRDPETCALNFSILSDSHIETNNLNRYKIFAGSLKDVKNNASGNDAVVFLGDNTMNCQTLENLIFHGTVANVLKGETILPVMGNHDIGNGNGDYDKLQKRWYSFTEAFFGRKLSHPYYYEVIDGYYFIVLGMEDHLVYEMMMTDEQFAWLEGVLAEAKNSGKPVFVFSHYPADDAIDEDGNATDRLIDMLAEYNRENDLFYFCGHTHMPLWLFWSFHTSDGFPEIYLPRLTELAGGDDNEIYEHSGDGVEVEVYPDHVLVRGRNFYHGNWKVDDEDTGELCEMTYNLKNPIG